MKIRDDVGLGQHSHVGMARTENQDFFGYWEPDDDRTFDVKGRLVVVCDGMGGHAGGEIASRLAVKTVIETYEKDPSDNVMEALRKAIEAANQTVYQEGRKPGNSVLEGMGTTATAVVHRRDMIYFGQVGDSRAYLIRGGQIQQMTKDHSLVQQLVDEGLLDKEEMENHPDKNVILRSLGVKPQVEVDISYVPASEGDIYLLCSDGLSGLVSDKEMLQVVRDGMANGKDLRKCAETLVDRANHYGGHDNITVQLLQIRGTQSATTDKTQPGTVTGQFSPEQVQASIAKARADALAKGKTPAAPAPAAAAPLPMTQESVPVPKLDEPARASSGGGGGKLVVGLVLGLLAGAGGLWSAVHFGVAPASKVFPKLSAGGGGAAGGLDEGRQQVEKARQHAERAQAKVLAAAALASAEQAEKGATTLPNLLVAAERYREAAEEAMARKAENDALTAQERAAAAREKPGFQAGEKLVQEGKAALEKKRWVDARVALGAARALFEAAGGS